MRPCLVCQYEAEELPLSEALKYRVQPAVYMGISLIFEAEIEVCEKHVIYVTDEFPETLKRIEDSGRS